ncbi:MD-2-related lipid recognition domain-containing protein [Arabidopsis thaliana]|uniref:MD-2-related lipid recognition domain-containing protein n=2 Tax=Arabidopsis thaliana TaxID=3702 RepID=B3H438_ARATH|nr:MD-2-related lipid recognition domain-containing protein [Arabidopsis thaliana]AED93219.1 MD-2-related lipid recognition domain-containing protein [Arabidopsis thaliana]CAA0404434.1 unnamed protein product [Arabidopsis thaliana]|eukprot:NP_001119267.1 MD-2-related lipid recognition domain-containing protein [Arabidopsis thaliana]
MAMSHVQPVLFFLASLFFLLALCSANDFEYCTKNGHDYGVVSWIEVFRVGPQENPTLTINVFAKEISAGTLVYVAYRSGDFTGLLKTYDLCDVSLACNIDSEIEAGDVFDFSLKDVLYVGFDEGIKYSVSLRQKTAEEEDPIIKMCIDFKVPASASAFVSI